MSIDVFDISWIGSRTLILDVFHLLRLFLYICVVCKCFFVSRMLVCRFVARVHLAANFFFGGFVIGGYEVFLDLCLSLL